MYLYFADVTTALNGDLAQQLAAASLIGIPAFTLFAINQFPKIEIDRDSVVVKWATGHKFFVMEEAKMDVRGHVLWLGGDYFVPFKEKQCMDLLSKRVETYRSKPFYIAYVAPPLFFGVLFALLKRPEGLFPPELWAILWGYSSCFCSNVVLQFSRVNALRQYEPRLSRYGL